MSGEPLPDTPTAADFRALAASAPWGRLTNELHAVDEPLDPPP